MKVSARNVLWGVITDIKKGTVNAEVALNLGRSLSLTAVITNGAVEKLGLEQGTKACAIIKATHVIVGTDLSGAKLSARNLLKGRVARIVEGPVSAEVEIDVGADAPIAAVITLGSAKDLGLREGTEAYALVKASSVIVGVE